MAGLLFTEIGVVLLLTIVNGLLSMSELAVVSARPARLKVLADQGSKGAAIALRLSEDPGRFLSTVQIGITAVGIVSGAFSGATLGTRLTEWLVSQGLPRVWADPIGFGGVVTAITYLSLVVGELAPKQIALRDPEKIAALAGLPMKWLSRLALPLVWLLDVSGAALLKLLGQKEEPAERVTEEEVKTIIAEAESAGVIESGEKDMIAGVMRLADRKAGGVMTPRRDVDVLDLSDSLDKIRAQIAAQRRYQMPVQDGTEDEIVGIVHVKDVSDALAREAEPDLRKLIQPAPIVADTARALDVIEALRASKVHLALVFDEYGHFEGIVTSSDVLEAIVGAFQDEDGDEPAIVWREDGSLLVSGWTPIDEFVDKSGVRVTREGDFQTVAGFALHQLARLPEVGEHFSAGGWRFEIVDMDGRRIDKLLVSKED
jgi:putative hemolysin